MQTGQPLAYLSKGLKGKSLHLSTYEKDLLALVMAVRKLRHYLLGHNFKFRTDQQALKYLLEQRIGTPVQKNGCPNSLDLISQWNTKGEGRIRLRMHCQEEMHDRTQLKTPHPLIQTKQDMKQ